MSEPGDYNGEGMTPWRRGGNIVEEAERIVRARDRRQFRRRELAIAGIALAASGGLATFLSGVGQSGPDTGGTSSYSSVVPDASPVAPTVTKSQEASASSRSEQEKRLKDLADAFALPDDAAAKYMNEMGFPQENNGRLVVKSGAIRTACDTSSAVLASTPIAKLSFQNGPTISELLTDLGKAGDAALRKKFYATVFTDPKVPNASLYSEFDPTGAGMGDIPSTLVSVSQFYNVNPDGNIASYFTVSTAINNNLQIGSSLFGEGFDFSNNTTLLHKLGFIAVDSQGENDSKGKEIEDDLGNKARQFTNAEGDILTIDTRGYLIFQSKGNIITFNDMPKWKSLVQADTPPEQAAVVGDAMAFGRDPSQQAAKVNDNLISKLPFGGENSLIIQIHDSKSNPDDTTDGGVTYTEKLYESAGKNS